MRETFTYSPLSVDDLPGIDLTEDVRTPGEVLLQWKVPHTAINSLSPDGATALVKYLQKNFGWMVERIPIV